MNTTGHDVGTRNVKDSIDFGPLHVAVNEFTSVASRVACEAEMYRAAIDGEVEWDELSTAARVLGLTPSEFEAHRCRVGYSRAVRMLSSVIRQLHT